MASWSPARLLIALVLGTGVGACFNEPSADVMFACDAAGEAACPVGYTCAEDGCCHRDGTEVTADNFGSCQIGGGQMATSGGMTGTSGTTMATTGPTSEGSSGETSTGVASTSTTSGSTGTTADATGTSETGASTGETDTSTGEMTTGGTTAGETTG